MTGRSGSTVSLFPLPFPQLLTPWASVGSHREGKVEGEPCSETAQSHYQKEETQEAAFWSCRGRPVGVLSTKGTRGEGKSKAGGKALTQKMEKAPRPPKRRRSQSLCAGGESRWLSRNGAGPLPSPPLLPPSLLSGGPQLRFQRGSLSRGGQAPPS